MPNLQTGIGRITASLAVIFFLQNFDVTIDVTKKLC